MEVAKPWAWSTEESPRRLPEGLHGSGLGAMTSETGKENEADEVEVEEWDPSGRYGRVR